MPIALRTRAQLKKALTVTPSQAAQRYFPKAVLARWATNVTDLAMPVLDAETGQTLEYRQLHRDPKYRKV